MAAEGASESVDSQKLLNHLTQVEGVAEDILADKQKLIDLDRHRNHTREAIRILQKDKKNNKQWLCFGNMFIKMETKSASRLMEKDFDQTEQEIAKTRTGMMPKLNHLRNVEHKDDLKGFQLQPFSKEEITAINDLL